MVRGTLLRLDSAFGLETAASRAIAASTRFT